MADTDPTPPTAVAPLTSPPKKVQFQQLGDRITELNESQSDLLLKLQGLKEELQNWRSKLNTQVKSYKDGLSYYASSCPKMDYADRASIPRCITKELSELKMALNSDLEQLRSEFKELKTTLQTQQDDVTLSLNNLVIQDAPEQTEEPKNLKVEDAVEKPEAPSSGNF